MSCVVNEVTFGKPSGNLRMLAGCQGNQPCDQTAGTFRIQPSTKPLGRGEGLRCNRSPMVNYLVIPNYVMRASQVSPVVKNSPANAGDAREAGLIPGSRRSPGEGNGNPLLYSCLGKSHGQRSLAGYSLSGCKESDYGLYHIFLV